MHPAQCILCNRKVCTALPGFLVNVFMFVCLCVCLLCWPLNVSSFDLFVRCMFVCFCVCLFGCLLVVRLWACVSSTRVRTCVTSCDMFFVLPACSSCLFL
jgi:hypothetical protein